MGCDTLGKAALLFAGLMIAAFGGLFSLVAVLESPNSRDVPSALAQLRLIGYLLFGALVVCAGLLMRIADRLGGPPRH